MGVSQSILFIIYAAIFFCNEIFFINFQLEHFCINIIICLSQICLHLFLLLCSLLRVWEVISPKLEILMQLKSQQRIYLKFWIKRMNFRLKKVKYTYIPKFYQKEIVQKLFNQSKEILNLKVLASNILKEKLAFLRILR